jgi:hypothetical protein
MINPTHDEEWEFDFARAWYARVILFFTTVLKRRRGLKQIHVRLAFVQYFHDYGVPAHGELNIIQSPGTPAGRNRVTELLELHPWPEVYIDTM